MKARLLFRSTAKETLTLDSHMLHFVLDIMVIWEYNNMLERSEKMD